MRFLGRDGVCDRQNDLSLYAIFIRSGGHNVDGQRRAQLEKNIQKIGLRFFRRGGMCDRQNDLSLFAIFISSGGHNVDGKRS